MAVCRWLRQAWPLEVLTIPVNGIRVRSASAYRYAVVTVILRDARVAVCSADALTVYVAPAHATIRIAIDPEAEAPWEEQFGG